MATISVLEQDVYPPRVLVTVSGLTLGDSVDVYRQVSSERTLIRGGSEDAVTDPAFVRVDAELPFGVPITYVAVVDGTTEISATPITVTLEGIKPVATDAVSGLAQELVILAWDQDDFSTQPSIFKVGGRNVVVSSDLGMYEATIEVFLENDSSVENFMTLLRSATQNIIQIRNADGSMTDYLSILGVSRRRYSQDGTDKRRRFVLNVAQVESWAPALEARAYTLQDIADYYGVSGTLTSIANDYTTLLSIAQGDFS